MKIHEHANAFPDLTPIEYGELRADIADNGQRVPIVLHEGRVLDGRHRARACAELGVEPVTVDLPEAVDPRAFVWAVNAVRRHLTPAARSIAHRALFGERKTKPGPMAEDEKTFSHPATPAKTAAATDQSAPTVRKAWNVQDAVEAGKSPPELLKAMQTGDVTASDAASVLDHPYHLQADCLRDVRKRNARSLAAALRWRLNCDELTPDARALDGDVSRNDLVLLSRESDAVQNAVAAILKPRLHRGVTHRAWRDALNAAKWPDKFPAPEPDADAPAPTTDAAPAVAGDPADLSKPLYAIDVDAPAGDSTTAADEVEMLVAERHGELLDQVARMQGQLDMLGADESLEVQAYRDLTAQLETEKASVAFLHDKNNDLIAQLRGAEKRANELEKRNADLTAKIEELGRANADLADALDECRG